MREITAGEIAARYRYDNPWWSSHSNLPYADLPGRAYLPQFYKYISMPDPNRAVVLMGPRRVGKTVLIHHAIYELIDNGVPANNILYVSVDAPVFTGTPLEHHVKNFIDIIQQPGSERLIIFLDEVQYLANWEVHLKSLVDTYPNYKFIVSGSAAAALRFKSIESGAGRFTDFMLPPLTFAEYLGFIEIEKDLIKADSENQRNYIALDIGELNRHFINYLNFGGYPEAVFSEQIKADPARFIKSDIIDKVLLRDLPGLYGIRDIQELNRLFTNIAYNTGEEISLEDLSQKSGVQKNTIVKYLEYLESAFLIKRIRKVTLAGQRFKRDRHFKVYLTNPSMRAALFGPVQIDSEDMGKLAETAVFAQWLHDKTYIESIYYGRWKEAEVDVIGIIEGSPRTIWAVEIKWSDKSYSNPSRIKGIIDYSKKHSLSRKPVVTTRTIRGELIVSGVPIEFCPTSLHCYTIGKNLIQNK